VRDFELDIRRRSGEVRHASLAVEQIDVKGEACMLTIIHDVTARKRAEAEVWRLNVELEQRVRDRTAQLAAANQELEAFSSSVSHDLRKPLHLMQGFTELLLGEYTAQLPAEAAHYLHRIHANVQQMGQLITALRSLSGLSRQALTTERIQPVDLVQKILAELRTEREGRHVEIVLGELPPCDADPILLTQVWVNLLTNALKFTRPRERARIEIGSRQTEEGCVYYVRDNGVGFDMRDAANLFGVFHRLPGAQAYEGTGIGLSIVRRIIERHGGQVWAEAAVNHGATFFFTLPGSPP
jgi:light-regulated signal transduction histidine kinase (bacteriophytochrome)